MQLPFEWARRRQGNRPVCRSPLQNLGNRGHRRSNGVRPAPHARVLQHSAPCTNVAVRPSPRLSASVLQCRCPAIPSAHPCGCPIPPIPPPVRVPRLSASALESGCPSRSVKCPRWQPSGVHPRLPHSRFLPIDKLDLDSFAKEKTAPGELALVKFLRMLDHICHDAPGKNLHFEPNADILRPVRPQIQPGFEIDRCISSRPQKPPGRKSASNHPPPPHLMAPNAGVSQSIISGSSSAKPSQGNAQSNSFPSSQRVHSRAQTFAGSQTASRCPPQPRVVHRRRPDHNARERRPQ